VLVDTNFCDTGYRLALRLRDGGLLEPLATETCAQFEKIGENSRKFAGGILIPMRPFLIIPAHLRVCSPVEKLEGVLCESSVPWSFPSAAATMETRTFFVGRCLA
jgi:hypothetical protein